MDGVAFLIDHLHPQCDQDHQETGERSKREKERFKVAG